MNYQPESSRSSLAGDTQELLRIIIDFLKDYAHDVKYVSNRRQVYDITKTYIAGGELNGKSISGLHRRIDKKVSLSFEFAKLTGLAFITQFPSLGIRESEKYEGPSFQIDNLRLVSRVGPDGNQVNQVIFTIFQRSGVIFENDEFKGHYTPPRSDGQEVVATKPVIKKSVNEKETNQRKFEFRGGCTLIFDLDKMQLKYVISKPVIAVESLEADNKPMIDHRRLDRQYEFQYGNEDSGFNEFFLYFGNGPHHITEPFAFLHQH
jgi:hypothetical protein